MRKLLGALSLLCASGAFAAVPTGSCTANVTSGVAPLAVSFDCTAVTGGTQFGDLLYQFNFGDSGAGSWSYGTNTALSRNFSTSPVAMHIFETGSATPYTVTYLVSNASGTLKGTIAITVTVPNTVFSTTKTICFYNTTVGSGCPAGATTTQTSSFNTAMTACAALTPPARCLFKKGNTFTSNAASVINKAGATTIGAYGTGTLPVIQSSTTSSAVLQVLGVDVVDGLRIMDLDIVGLANSTDATVCINLFGGATSVTVLRVTCRDIGAGMVTEAGSTGQGGGVQDSNFYNLQTEYAIYGAYKNFGLLGNSFGPILNAGGGGHVVRLQNARYVTVSNNDLTHPATGTQTILTLRALEHGVAANTDSFYVYFSDNKLTSGGTGAQMFQIGPASLDQNNWIYDVIVERNMLVTDSVSTEGLYIMARRVTVRYNVCNGAAGAGGFNCYKAYASNTTGNVPDPTAIRFLNNTCYADGTPGFIAFRCVTLQSANQSITASVVENNLSYAPATGSSGEPVLLLTEQIGAGTVTGTVGASGTRGNSSDSQVRNTSPLFDNVGAPPFGFRIGTGSYAINATGAVTEFPRMDFGLCTNKAGNIASGAFNPRTQAQCKGAGN